MPIRMVKDEGNSSQDNYPGNGGGRNRGGGGGGIIALLLMLFGRNPKLLIFVAVIAAGYYMFSGGSCNKIANVEQVAGIFNRGATLDQKVYDKAEVYEPVTNNRINPLPEAISLMQFAPQRLNQGQQGSCVGWGTTYAGRTILEAVATNKDPNTIAFSPSYVYNQIHLEDCQGSYILEAMKVLEEGALPLSEFKYSDEDCSRKPNTMERQNAEPFKIKGAVRLSKSGDDYKTDLVAIKQHLAQNAPVVIGMMVGGTFMQEMMGNKVWIPSADDYNMQGFGGHCMTIIGYDDYLEEGAFQIMNSWGNEWGENGIGWVRYKDFDWFVKEAYGMYPLKNASNVSGSDIDLKIVLLNPDNETTYPIRSSGQNKALTVTPLRINDKFKVEITNNVECYVYIFGEELDKSSYVLFPYTKKHSPYCGITGTRVFPKDYSMQLDEKGTQDKIVFMITRKPIDYFALNEKINEGVKSGVYSMLSAALETKLAKNVQATGVSAIRINGKMNLDEVYLFEVSIDK